MDTADRAGRHGFACDPAHGCVSWIIARRLEAIRLLLFLKHTAFVIASDDQIIQHVVKRHFQRVDDKLVINYFDKLLQVHIHVTPLGTQEIRAYMMMFFVENSSMDPKEFPREDVNAPVHARADSVQRG